MCNIYYPFFKIELSGCEKKYNHIMNIFILSLFCNKILIPARHLLEMENDKIDILMNNEKLFQKDIIYCRIPEDSKNLYEYYEKIKKDNPNKKIEAIDIRIQKITKKLYGGKKCEQYSIVEQQDYYYSKMQKFLKEYAIKHRNVKGMEDLKRISDSDPFYKEKFDLELYDLKNDKIITQNTFKRIKKVSDLLYFLAGSSAKEIKVCHDEFFDNQNIQPEIETIVTNYDDKINKKYSPDYITALLKKIGVIVKESDLEKLNIDDVIYLRNLPYFKVFIRKYEEYSSRTDFEIIFEKKKKHFDIVYELKATIVSVGLAILGAILLFIVAKKLLVSIVFSVLTLIVTYFITILWQSKGGYKIPLIDKILDRIVGCIDPIALYFAKLKWRLASKE